MGFEMNKPNWMRNRNEDVEKIEIDECNGGCVCEHSLNPLKDSGARETSITGGQKEPSNGRGNFALLPFEVIWDDAVHYEKGAAKYAARNFEKGIEFSKCFSSALRHMIQFWLGDRSEPHLIAARWHLAAMQFYCKRIEEGTLPEELDDRPVYKEKK